MLHCDTIMAPWHLINQTTPNTPNLLYNHIQFTLKQYPIYSIKRHYHPALTEPTPPPLPHNVCHLYSIQIQLIEIYYWLKILALLQHNIYNTKIYPFIRQNTLFPITTTSSSHLTPQHLHSPTMHCFNPWQFTLITSFYHQHLFYPNNT